MSNAAFFFVDGEATKGAWIDLDGTSTIREVRKILINTGLMTPDYDGDILVAEAEGICKAFLSSHGFFSFDTCISCLGYLDSNSHIEPDAVTAYIHRCGKWDAERFQEAYRGQYDSEAAYAEEYLDSTGLLDEVPEELRGYIDFESYGRDLFLNDYWMSSDGYVFTSM